MSYLSNNFLEPDVFKLLVLSGRQSHYIVEAANNREHHVQATSVTHSAFFSLSKTHEACLLFPCEENLRDFNKHLWAQRLVHFSIVPLSKSVSSALHILSAVIRGDSGSVVSAVVPGQDTEPLIKYQLLSLLNLIVLMPHLQPYLQNNSCYHLS